VNTVWKYALPVRAGEFEFSIKQNPGILTLEVQDGRPAMWCLVNTEDPDIKTKLTVIETGKPLPEQGQLTYLGTAQLKVPFKAPGDVTQEATYVLHYFAEGHLVIE
jgi:hypothetical protein